MSAGNGIQLTASAGKTLPLEAKLFDEGGQRISSQITDWSVSCSWATTKVSAAINAQYRVKLPPVTMPREADQVQPEQIQLCCADGSAVDTARLLLQSVPPGLCNTGSLMLQGKDSLQPGQPCTFRLSLRDTYGHSISQPAKHFELCDATISWDSAQPVSCESSSGLNLDIKTNVPATAHPGPHSISCKARLQPNAFQLQQLPNDDVLEITAQLDVPVTSGPATQIILHAPPTCRELDMIHVRAQARDAAGNETDNVGELRLSIHIGSLAADLVSDTGHAGAWSADVALALIPETYTISLKAQGRHQLALGHGNITVLPSSRICTIKLELAEGQPASVTAAHPFRVVAELQLAGNAPARSITAAEAAQGLEVVLRHGRQHAEQCMLILDSNTSGLRFEFKGTGPTNAGQAFVEATWREQDAQLKPALDKAQQSFKDPSANNVSPWQPPISGQLAMPIVPGAPRTMQAHWVRHSSVLNFGGEVKARGLLPLLGIRLLDTYDNQVQLGTGPCKFEPQICISPAQAAKGYKAPQLASSDSNFEGHWDGNFHGFVLPEAASRLGEEVCSALSRYQVEYKIQPARDSSLAGLATAVIKFWYRPAADVSRQRSSQIAARADVGPATEQAGEVCHLSNLHGGDSAYTDTSCWLRVGIHVL